MSDKKFGTYSVIPTEIMLNREISSTAKLLYGIISSLTNEKAYCWASNEYLGELLGISKTRISILIKELAELGVIESTIEKNYKRQIKLKGVLTKVKGGVCEKLKGDMRKVKHNNIKNNINEYNNIITSEPSSQVNSVMNEFYEINPGLNFGNKTQRTAVEEMIKKWGTENLIGMIRKYRQHINEKFMPVATTPIAFKNKIGDIKVGIDKLNKNKLVTNV